MFECIDEDNLPKIRKPEVKNKRTQYSEVTRPFLLERITKRDEIDLDELDVYPARRKDQTFVFSYLKRNIENEMKQVFLFDKTNFLPEDCFYNFKFKNRNASLDDKNPQSSYSLQDPDSLRDKLRKRYSQKWTISDVNLMTKEEKKIKEFLQKSI